MIPTFPNSATFGSILGAGVRLGILNRQHGNIRLLLDSYGHREASHYGLKADLVSSDVLSGLVSSKDLLASHSLMLLHRRFLTEADECSLIGAIENEGTLAKMFLPARHLDQRNSSFRYCTLCADKDEKDFGCTHWRVEHQLPPIHHCPWHRILLCSACAACGASFAHKSRLRLPRDPCISCGSLQGTSEAREFPSAYWSYLNLCTRALNGAAPELRPLARQALVRQLKANCIGERGQDLSQSLFESWGVSSLQGLEEHTCSSTGPSAFDHLLRSGSAATSNYLTMAVISFSLDNLSPEQVSAVLQDDYGHSPLQALVSKERPLEEVLVEHARRVGFPVEVCTLMARGGSVTAVARSGRTTAAATSRFLDGLSEELRQQIALAREEFLDARQKLKVEVPLKRMRAAALDVLAAGDSRRGSIPSGAYNWLRANDQEWLDMHFPRTWNMDLAAIQPEKRNAAMEHKTRGIDTTEGLRSAAPPLFSWLYRHDKAWLLSIFSVRYLRDPSQLRSKWRSVAQAFVDSGGVTREALRRSSSSAYKWLIANDSAWFDELLPQVSVQNQSIILSKWRTVALNAKSTGAVTRADLKRVAPSADRWLMENDRSWLYETFPSSRIYGFSHLRRKWRSIATVLAERGVVSRGELGRANPSAHAWLAKNDREWFFSLFIDNWEHLQSRRRSKWRSEVESQVSKGVRTLTDLSRVSHSAYKWLAANDRLWLDAVFLGANFI